MMCGISDVFRKRLMLYSLLFVLCSGSRQSNLEPGIEPTWNRNFEPDSIPNRNEPNRTETTWGPNETDRVYLKGTFWGK